MTHTATYTQWFIIHNGFRIYHHGQVNEGNTLHYSLCKIDLFDTVEEYQNQMAAYESLNILYNGEIITVERKNEDYVDALVADKLRELWYTGKGEVAINALDENSQWHEEAVAVAKWINECYAYLLEHINEENFDNFVNGLPTLNLTR